MLLFLTTKFFGFKKNTKYKQSQKISLKRKFFTTPRVIFPLGRLKCNENNFSGKILDYIDSLPGDFLKDPNGPPIFSYSWLQRIGRMDIFSEKIENESGAERNFSNLDLVKSDPIFRLPKKKKKKFLKRILI